MLQREGMYLQITENIIPQNIILPSYTIKIRCKERHF